MSGSTVSKWIMIEAKSRAMKEGSGIYAIVNIVNGHVYIGQSRVLGRREHDHFRDLRKGNHINTYLQNAFTCYGEKNFKFVVLEYVENIKTLDEREQYWIDRTLSCYNLMKTVGTYPITMDKDKTNYPDGRYIKDGESFDRPEWHKWVYGGGKKPYAK